MMQPIHELPGDMEAVIDRKAELAVQAWRKGAPSDVLAMYCEEDARITSAFIEKTIICEQAELDAATQPSDA